ncbi:hypothetical protein F5X99DRAFT_105043 [Biscogniauxia marginata]|nr:hypothetical protein F5X99DRAFT_105043 [Biscogniauxia marginata]
MCRRIITHQMHHDVRVPMVMNSDPCGEKTIYANPLRTPYHRCEISQPWQSQCISNGLTCKYHSCCMPWEEVHYCAEMGFAFLEEQDYDVTDDLEEELAMTREPEECDYFSLVHYHQHLPYFGDMDAYPWSPDPYQYPYYPEGAYGAPATWRDDLTRLPEQWCTGFAHDAKYRGSWDELFFLECETLYEAECDAQTQRAVLADLAVAENQEDHCQSLPSPPPQCNTTNPTVAWDNLLRAEKRLREQRKLVHELTQWALEPCGMCEGR